MIIAKMLGNKYFISAHLLETADWGVLNIINTDNFPVQNSKEKYFFVAIAMLTLLLGFVALLFLLYQQLSMPLGKLLSATKKLEDGDFDSNVSVNDRTELGAIALAFNHMVQKLKEVYSDLAATVSDRTKALDELQKIDNAKITFFQNISHELRTPMHGILSFSRLGIKLNHKYNPDKVYKYFNNINISAERLMKMIDSIMDLAKLESGHMTFYFQNVNFLLPIHQIEAELKASFIEKDITLIMNLPDDEFMLSLDVDMMRRVYRNLLGNAIKMSNPGTTIEVLVEYKADVVQFSVLDEGPGIPLEDINTIFDKFVQAGEGKKRGGTGLGLALCREILDAHKGEICATNRPQGGACFSFTIPLTNTEGDV